MSALTPTFAALSCCLVVLGACTDDETAARSGAGLGGAGAGGGGGAGNGGDASGGGPAGGAGGSATGGSGGEVALVFSSDWSTALGTSDDALRDGGAWDTLYCQSADQTLTVISGAEVGFSRTANVLRVQQLGETVCGTLERAAVVPVSTTHWGRLYFRNDEVETTHNHVATYNPIGDIQVSFWNRQGTVDGAGIFARTYYDDEGSSNVYPFNLWNAGTAGVGADRLENGTWYRYEWMMEYVTPTTYRLHPRIYDLAGTLLYDEASFFQNDYPQSGEESLATWYASGRAFGFSDEALAQNLGLGNEGPATSAATGGHWYHAAVALSLEGWIGP